MRGKAPIRFGSTAQPKAQSLYRPLSEPLAIVFSKEVPKPDCLGSVTGGPPRSCHLKLSLLLLSSAVIVHATVTLPSSVHGAPYFAALVASSWTASEKFCAYCALTITSMPSIFIRSRYGSTSSSTISFKSTPLQFALSVRGYFAPKRAGVLQRPSLQWPMGIHQKDSCALWIEPRRASCCFGAVPHERVVEDLIQTPLEVLTLSDEQIAKQTHSATRGLPDASEATFGYPPRTALPEIGGKPTAGRHCEFQVPTVSGYRSAR
jgi:hypothetical protein